MKPILNTQFINCSQFLCVAVRAGQSHHSSGMYIAPPSHHRYEYSRSLSRRMHVYSTFQLQDLSAKIPNLSEVFCESAVDLSEELFPLVQEFVALGCFFLQQTCGRICQYYCLHMLHIGVCDRLKMARRTRAVSAVESHIHTRIIHSTTHTHTPDPQSRQRAPGSCVPLRLSDC